MFRFKIYILSVFLALSSAHISLSFDRTSISNTSNSTVGYWSSLHQQFPYTTSWCLPLDPILVTAPVDSENDTFYVTVSLQNTSQCQGFPLEQTGETSLSSSSNQFQVGNFTLFYNEPVDLSDLTDLSFQVQDLLYQKMTYQPFNWIGTFDYLGLDGDGCFPAQFSCLEDQDESSFYTCQWNWPSTHSCAILGLSGNWTTRSFYSLNTVCLTYPSGCLYLSPNTSNPNILSIYEGAAPWPGYTRSLFGLQLETASFIILLLACFLSF